LDGVHFSYNGTAILQDIRLTIKQNEFVCFLGPSGCGKTTLLRLMAGLGHPLQGKIIWNGKGVTAPSLERGVVFQDYSLFSWMTLRDNIALAIGKACPEKKKADRQVLAAEFLEMVGLGASVKKYPFELSGGMRQRGAIARALAVGSPALLMDEPFGALDPLNRAKLQDLLLEIWTGATPSRNVVFITHDVDEALLLADRVVILGAAPGRVIEELTIPFERPRVRAKLLASAEFQALQEKIAECYHTDMLRQIDASASRYIEGEGI
jgi:NitT/TauT family transport system ATP-binding protein